MHLHEKLKITFPELGALLGFREMLKMNLIEASEFDMVQEGKHRFNMLVPFKRMHCGTVGCIGGNMGWIMGVKSPYNYVMNLKYGHVEKDSNASPALKPLFYPPDNISWRTLGAAQAIAAIDNFLKDGDPRWHTACYAGRSLDAAVTPIAVAAALLKPKKPKRKVAVKPRRKK